MATTNKKNNTNEPDDFNGETSFTEPESVEIQFIQQDGGESERYSDGREPDEISRLREANERLWEENRSLQQVMRSQKNQAADDFRITIAELIRDLSVNSASGAANRPTESLQKRLHVLLKDYPNTWV